MTMNACAEIKSGSCIRDSSGFMNEALQPEIELAAYGSKQDWSKIRPGVGVGLAQPVDPAGVF